MTNRTALSAQQLTFYQFLGAQSLLIGLFPFFIPVWLWNEGYSLAKICLFISGTGLSFCIALRCWEHISCKIGIAPLLLTTFILELVVLGVAFGLRDSSLFLLLFAVVNGFYNCFFWTTQRSLFLDLVNPENSGRQFGNFQIFVVFFLKAGILCGGLLLEHVGMFSIVLVSTTLTIFMGLYFYTRDTRASDLRNTQSRPVDLRQLILFSDKLRSRQVFIADGLFLFLESHLWTISLFLLIRESFANLGMTVIVLAVVFSGVFYVTKNSIDRITGEHIFKFAVAGYAVSWVLRATVDENTETQWMIIILLLVTFSTSFFRLIFNKRFYDVANYTTGRTYLVYKSYFTQLSQGCIFSLLALTAFLINDDKVSLKIIYLAAAGFALFYAGYRSGKA